MSSDTVVIVVIIAYVVYLIPLSGVFSKTREPAWAAFIPIWNLLVLLKIVGRPWWWIFLFIIPVVDIVVAIIVWYDLSKRFGHRVAFTVGLVVLSWIFLLILWLGSSQYQGSPAAAGTSV
jgi:hypothetical protein